MNSHDEHEADLDHRIRQALDPDRDTVDRLVRQALDPTREPRSRVGSAPRFAGWRPASVVALVVVVVAAVWLLTLVLPSGSPNTEEPPAPIAQLGTGSPQPDREVPAPVIGELPPSTPPGAAALRISNVGSVVTVASAGGSQWIVLPGDNS